MDIKAIKVCKLLHICAIIYIFWYLVLNNNDKKNHAMVLYFLTNMNANILEWTKKCKYEYKYIQVEKKGQIEIYLGWQKKG